MSKAKKPAKKPAKKKVVAKAKAAVKKPAKAKVKTAPKAAKVKVKPLVKVAKPAKPVKLKKPVVVVAPKATVAAVPKAAVVATPKTGKPAKVVVAPKPEPVAKVKEPKKAKAPPVEVVEVELEPTEPEITEEIVLTDAEGRRYCRVKDCDQLSTVDTYCRYHYLLYWKRIQVRKKILTEGKLERYVEELTARYPDKFLDMLRKDLRSEKEFVAAIQELEIDESGDGDFENEEETFIDEVRGMQEAPSTTEEDF